MFHFTRTYVDVLVDYRRSRSSRIRFPRDHRSDRSDGDRDDRIEFVITAGLAGIGMFFFPRVLAVSPTSERAFLAGRN